MNLFLQLKKFKVGVAINFLANCFKIVLRDLTREIK